MRRGTAALAVAAMGAFVAVLGVRTLTTEDLGYHLAYGEHFLDTGRIVDTDRFVYPTVPREQARFELAPGAWYDEDGRYRFPNANWLSQVVMAQINRWAGPEGLSVLLAGLVAGTFVLIAAAMRRLGLGWLSIATGLGAMAMVSYERFLLRPELFGYLILAGQLFLLSCLWRPEGGRLSWPAAAGLVVLQCVLVNLHSYFLLGLGLTGAALAGQLLRRRSSPGDGRCAVRLGVVLALQAAVCFANPWTWRLAVLPIRTLAFMQAHQIAGGELIETGHPWAVIGEFFRPFAPGVFVQSKASYAYCVLLALAGAGATASAVRRRWAGLLIIAAMTAISLSMRRNIAPAALMVVPLSFAACGEVLARLAGRWRIRRRWLPAAGWALLLAALGAWGVFSVVTQRFYYREQRASRFGLGIAPTVVPVGAAEWIGRNKPAGRLWTDYNSSSSLHYFTASRPDVPVLTNTWAYPPDAMRLVLDVSLTRQPLAPVAEAAGAETVALRMDPTSIRLARQLVADPNWALVYLGALDVVFLRADGKNAELAARSAIRPRTLDLEAYKRRLRAMDPVGSFPLYLGAFTLAHLGWDTQAVDLLDDLLTRYPDAPDRHRFWNMKGTCLAHRGTLLLLRDPPDHRAKEDWHEAKNCFQQALAVKPDYYPAANNLREVQLQIDRQKQGVRFVYTWAPMEFRVRN